MDEGKPCTNLAHTRSAPHHLPTVTADPSVVPVATTPMLPARSTKPDTLKAADVTEGVTKIVDLYSSAPPRGTVCQTHTHDVMSSAIAGACSHTVAVTPPIVTVGGVDNVSDTVKSNVMV